MEFDRFFFWIGLETVQANQEHDLEPEGQVTSEIMLREVVGGVNPGTVGWVGCFATHIQWNDMMNHDDLCRLEPISIDKQINK